MATTPRDRLGSLAYAFRGYNVTNLGRSCRACWRIPMFGPIVEGYLRGQPHLRRRRAPQGRPGRARAPQRGNRPRLYDEAMSLIVAMELAQVRLLEEFFDVRLERARMVFGYSLGELTAVCAARRVRHAKRPQACRWQWPADCVALADGVTMGVLFSRGPVLDFDEVQAALPAHQRRRAGVIGISSFLAPNTVLLLGQIRHGRHLRQADARRVSQRVFTCARTSDQWPPVHTPLVWQTQHSQPRGRDDPIRCPADSPSRIRRCSRW